MIARLMGLATLSPAQLDERMRHGPLTVIDVNPPARWAAAHVPGAVNLDPTGFAERDLPADTAAPLVFYCSNFLCRKAPNAARRARAMGYENVHILSAGIAGWLDARLPTEPGATSS
jgi:rhodanese-related sulfurtransferase